MERLELEIPFNLEDLLTINWNTGKLKLVLEWFLQTLKQQQDQLNQMADNKNLEQRVKKNEVQIAELQEKVKTQEEQLKKMAKYKEKIKRNKKQIEDLREELKKLKAVEVRIEKVEQNISVLQIQINVIEQKVDKTDFQLLRKTVDEILSRLKILESIDPEMIKLLNNLQSLFDRVKKLEQVSADHTQDIALLKEMLKKLQEALKQKADLSDIDELKALIASIGKKGESAPVIQGMSAQEKAMLNDLLQRVQVIEQNYVTFQKAEATYAKISDLAKYATKAEFDYFKKEIERLLATLSQKEGAVDPNLILKIQNALDQFAQLLKKMAELEKRQLKTEDNCADLENKYQQLLQEIEALKKQLAGVQPGSDFDINIL